MENQANAGESRDRHQASTELTSDAGRGRNSAPLAIMLAGAVVLGATGGWLAVRADEPSAIEMVSPADVPLALTTLSQGVAQNVRADYRGCRYPLGYISVATPGNAAGGTIRIRSGNYESPRFAVSDKPQRIAIPHPLPQTGGIQLLTVEGDAKGLVVALYPATSMEPVNHTASVNVIWRPRPPCQS